MLSKTLPLALGAALSLALSAHASEIVENATAPETSLISQPDFSGGVDSGCYVDSEGPTGQTFMTGDKPITVTAITVKGSGNPFGGFETPRHWVLSVNEVTGSAPGNAGDTLTRVAQEISGAYTPTGESSYITITFDNPVQLKAKTLYEFDLYTSEFKDGTCSQPTTGGYYSFARSKDDIYPDGVAMQNGETKRVSPDPGSITNPKGSDRTFFIQGTETTP